MAPKRVPASDGHDATPPETRADQHCESIVEAYLVLTRMLGRQAARDWLSADLCPPEGDDDE
jgi:hypothetical protein